MEKTSNILGILLMVFLLIAEGCYAVYGVLITKAAISDEIETKKMKKKEEEDAWESRVRTDL